MDEKMKATPGKYFWLSLSAQRMLLLVALSIVIFMFGSGSPMVQAIPQIGVRRLITGFLFGSTGALISISRIGKVSGAHLNPIVTLGFWLMRKINAEPHGDIFLVNWPDPFSAAYPYWHGVRWAEA